MWFVLWMACFSDAPVEVHHLRIEPAHPVAGSSLRCVDASSGEAVEAAWWSDGLQVGHGPNFDASSIPSGQSVSCRLGSTTERTVMRPASLAVGGNVLLIVADDMGVDKLSLYDPPTSVAKTPSLASLAAEGVVFDRAYTNSICSPSRATILTGRHARRSGVGTGINVMASEPSLPLEEVLIPELLAQAQPAYSSAAVGKWHLASRETSVRTHPVRQGFTHFAGSASNLMDGQTPGKKGQDYFNWVRLTEEDMGRETTYATTSSVDDALRFAESLPEPWFIYLAFHAPHQPFHVPPKELVRGRAKGDAATYDLMVEALDAEIGRLMDGVSTDDTTVVFVADNGTPKAAVRAPFDKDRAKGTLYEGGVHVPLIVAGRAVRQPGRRSDALVHTVDLLPTIAELAGVELPRRNGRPVVLDGRSVLPLLRFPDASGSRDTVYVEQFGPSGCNDDCRYDQRALVSRRWKLLERNGRPRVMLDLEAGEVEALRPPFRGAESRAWAQLNAQMDAQAAWLMRDKTW